MSWCPATNLPHHRMPQSLRVRGGNTGSAQGSHPCTGDVLHREGQVRSRDGDSRDWGNETQADCLYRNVFPGRLWWGGWEYDQSLKCSFIFLWSKSFFDPSPKPVTHHIPNKEDKGDLRSDALWCTAVFLWSWLTFFCRFLLRSQEADACICVGCVCIRPSKPQTDSCPAKLLILT